MNNDGCLGREMLVNPLNTTTHYMVQSYLLFVQVTFISATREENKL